MIEVSKLSVEYFYGDKALRDLSFSLENNEVLAVIGEEEAGKTTLIKSICKLVYTSSGNIFVDDTEVIKFEKDIFQVVFWENSFFKHRSVHFNMSNPLKYRKFTKEEINNKINQCLTRFNLQYLSNVPIYKLSTEEKVLLLFARLLMRQSKVILIDNVFSKLSSNKRLDIFLKCKENILPNNIPFVFCTDSVDEAISIGNKILVLRYGFVEQYGYTFEVKDNPKTLYVDKLINKERTFKEIDESDVLFPQNVIVNNNKLFISYKLIENFDGSGIFALPINYYYSCGNYFVNTNLGLIVTKQLKERYFVKIDHENIRYYYYDSEKRFDI